MRGAELHHLNITSRFHLIELKYLTLCSRLMPLFPSFTWFLNQPKQAPCSVLGVAFPALSGRAFAGIQALQGPYYSVQVL